MVQYLIMNNTNQQFDHVIGICRAVFVKKMKDYGTAWRILRPQSMTDQIYIKAQRIRSIEEKGVAKIAEDARDEFIGIINYCSMALIQLELGPSDDELPPEITEKKYMDNLEKAKSLMMEKNHSSSKSLKFLKLG